MADKLLEAIIESAPPSAGIMVGAVVLDEDNPASAAVRLGLYNISLIELTHMVMSIVREYLPAELRLRVIAEAMTAPAPKDAVEEASDAIH